MLSGCIPEQFVTICLSFLAPACKVTDNLKEMQPMEQHISLSHSESELNTKEEDIEELVLKRPCTTDEQHSDPEWKKQKVSVTKANSGHTIKLVDKV
jgi:hypothetical protein